jgi:hypothetical protein
MENMNKTLENLWVAALDSNQFRKFARARVGGKIFASSTYQKLLWKKNYISTRIAGIRQPDLFKDVQTFVFFIGHNKSGTSMIGSLLDAHPNAIVADEVGAIHYFSRGFNLDQVFHLLLRGSRRELMKGRVTARRLTPYSYLVPGQWQGRYQVLNVVGDGRAGSTTNLLSSQPQLLNQLSNLKNAPKIRIIQSIRNPYDVISVMMTRGNRSFENSISHFFNNCDVLVKLRSQLDGSSLFPLYYEKFVQSPGEQLIALIEFLGLDQDETYIESCLSIIHKTPVIHRHMVDWNDVLIDSVKQRIKNYDFLEGYTFD